MSIENFSEAEKRGHEQITYFYYPEVGLKAIVAIHSTVLGPALGGCRMRVYASEAEAINDVMRLSEGMTYKNSVAGLDLGGGKSCIIADSSMTKGREELFTKFGECLENLAGRYISAEDMGTNVKDVMTMKKKTSHVSGTALEDGGGGEPSPWTALGVFQGMLAVCERKYGSKDLSGKHVTIQGVGHVGKYLAEHLIKAGAKLTVCDVSSKNVEEISKKFKVNVVSSEEIYSVPCDIYSPNAIGQTVNKDTLKTLKCSIIAGAANNQLSDASVYEMIKEKNIVYCPDFVINAGGVINCASESRKEGWSESWTRDKVNNIYNTIHQVLSRAEKENKFPEIIALQIAKERISGAKARN
jgi:leucine dehydrogenase